MDQNNEIDGHIEMLKEQAFRNANDIKSIFLEIRNIIDDKEKQIIEGITNILEKEESYLTDKKTNNTT